MLLSIKKNSSATEAFKKSTLGISLPEHLTLFIRAQHLLSSQKSAIDSGGKKEKKMFI
jgi:hypothetical protein